MTASRLAVLALLVTGLALAPTSPPAQADDTSILKDFNEVKKKGRAVNKERAEFWAKKGVTGKDLYWHARLYDEAGEDEKAAEVYEEYLKVTDLGEKNNREPAMTNIVRIHSKKRNWQKVVDTAERLRTAFPEGTAKAESFDLQGRAYRMLKDPEKAAASFSQAADLGHVSGAVNLAEMHVANGKLDEGKATLAKYIADFEAQPLKARGAKSLSSVQEMFGVIGKPAPSLESATSVGRDTPPKELKEKPSVLCFWHMSWPGTDVALQLGNQFAKAFGEAARVVAVSTYNKYNPLTRKVEDALPPEEEAKLWRQYLGEAPNGSPSIGVVVPVEVREGLQMDQPGQLVVVDKEGVIRYVRPADPTDMMYPWLCVQEFVDKLIGK